MSSTGKDAIILKNQPVAREGVLEYNDGRKLKRWDDLQKNIGRIVPILDEHPGADNGNRGLYSGKEERFGYGIVKACPGGNKQLCADLVLADGAPVKAGYSIGYPFLNVREAGHHADGDYDAIQASLVIDHIALTDGPRDNKALAIAPDSEEPVTYMPAGDSVDNRAGIVINGIGYDSFMVRSSAPAGKDALAVEQVLEMLRKDNPTASDELLLPRAKKMLENSEKLAGNTVKGSADSMAEAKENEKKEDMEEEEPEDKDKDSLIAEVARLRADRDARKSMERQVEVAAAEARAARDAADRYKSLFEKEMSSIIQTKVDSLLNDHGFDATEFDGKHAEYISGALYAAQRLGRKPSLGTSTAKDTRKRETGRPLSVNDYIYDFDSKKMVRRVDKDDEDD